MLRLKAESFYRVTSGLHILASRMERLREELHPHEDGGFIITPETDPVAADFMRQQAIELIDNLQTLGTDIALISAKNLLVAVSKPDGFLWSAARHLADEIHQRLRDELSLVTVFVLEKPNAALYEPADPLFCQEVAAKFQTNAAFEIDEAAKCLALARPTASVFHLMRTMEVGIKGVAQCLGIPDPVRAADRNWGAILRAMKGDIDSRSGASPTKMWTLSGDKEFFEEIYVSIDAVRIAWRNTTMHVEKKYTDDEAEHVFVAVKGFMKRLASRCDENGEPKA
jgi:hypothetical protein